MQYLDFWEHVEKLLNTLLIWQRDPSEALTQDCRETFPGVRFIHDHNQLASLLAISEDKKSAVKDLLKKMAASMMEVTRRQLEDFLPGGKFHSNQDPELRKRLEHSCITNLVAEQSFADLDFSLFKRRNCTLHHHTTISMLKRNKSVTNWFLGKSAEEKERLLEMSAKKGPALRKKNVALECSVLEQRRRIMEKEKRDAAEQKRRERVDKIVDDLRQHGGPCRDAADVDRILDSHRTVGGLKGAIRTEILYHKVVLQQKSPLLVATGTPLEIVNRLRLYLGADPLEELPPRPQPHPRPDAPARKRPNIDSSDEEEEEDDVDEEGDEEGTHVETETEFETEYKFTQLGEIVAVYYVQGCYIGEVVEITEGGEEGTVLFMEKARGRADVYRWPPVVRRQDRERISSSVVFARNLGLAPFSSSGRAFVVERPRNLQAVYQAFRDYLVSTCDL